MYQVGSVYTMTALAVLPLSRTSHWVSCRMCVASVAQFFRACLWGNERRIAAKPH